MDSSKSGTPMAWGVYIVKLAKRLWDDTLIWATMWPLFFSILILWKDQFFVLNNGFIIWVVTVVIGGAHVMTLFLSGVLMTANVIAAHANPNGGSNLDGSMNTLTSNETAVFLSGYQKGTAWVLRMLLVCFLAYVPLQALSVTMVDSWKLKQLTDCLNDKIESVENGSISKDCNQYRIKSS